MALPAEQVVRRILNIAGVYNYEPEDLAAALDFLSANIARFPFETLVGKTFSLDQVQAAFEYAEAVSPPRVAILPASLDHEKQSNVAPPT